MGIEGGGIGGAVGGVGGVGLGISSGIEAGGLAAGVASAAAGLETRFGPVMGPVDTGLIGSEGVFKGSMADFNPITLPVPDLGGTSLPLEQMNVDVGLQAGEVAGRAWNLSSGPDVLPQIESATVQAWDFNVVTQAEEVLIQAQKPVMISNFEPEVFKWIPAFAGMTTVVEPAILPQVERMVLPFPKPEVVVPPVLRPAVQIGPQTAAGAAAEVRQVTATQPAPEEQELEEEVIERVIAKQIDTVREEIEELRSKIVVDEEVLENRMVGLTGAAEIAAAKSEGGEIEGNEIVALAPFETEDKRSGLIKKNGPDGSWVETLEEIAARRFNSVKEAKKQIVEIINRKVPVKRGKEGKNAGSEAVARVLKYLFVKAVPVEQIVTRVIKKQKVSVKDRQPLVVEAPKPEARIDDFPVLAEVFPKAA